MVDASGYSLFPRDTATLRARGGSLNHLAPEGPVILFPPLQSSVLPPLRPILPGAGVGPLPSGLHEIGPPTFRQPPMLPGVSHVALCAGDPGHGELDNKVPTSASPGPGFPPPPPPHLQGRARQDSALMSGAFIDLETYVGDLPMSLDPSLPETGGVARGGAIVYRDDGHPDEWCNEPESPTDASVAGDADGRSASSARKLKHSAKSDDTPSGSESNNISSDGSSAFCGRSANRRKFSRRRAHGGSRGRSASQTSHKSGPVGVYDDKVRLFVATSWARYVDNQMGRGGALRLSVYNAAKWIEKSSGNKKHQLQKGPIQRMLMGMKEYVEERGKKASGRGRGRTDRRVAEMDKSKMQSWRLAKDELSQVRASATEAAQHVGRIRKTRPTTTAALSEDESDEMSGDDSSEN